jgi:hypothetical protein
MTGAMPASSQASRALSTSSLRITSGQAVGGWPVSRVSSSTLAKSRARELRKAVRSTRTAGFGAAIDLPRYCPFHVK